MDCFGKMVPLQPGLKIPPNGRIFQHSAIARYLVLHRLQQSQEWAEINLCGHKKSVSLLNLMLGICKRFYAFEEAQDLFNSISGYSVQACKNGRCRVRADQGLTVGGQVWVGLDGVWEGQIEGCLPVRAESFARLSAPNRSGRLTLLTGGSNQSIAALIQLDLHQLTQAETLIGNSCSTRKGAKSTAKHHKLGGYSSLSYVVMIIDSR